MKIVAWNCRMALHSKFDDLRSREPDIAVVSEAASPGSNGLEAAYGHSSVTSFAWCGLDPSKKGLAVLGFNGYRLEDTLEELLPPHYVVPFCVRGPTSFQLLAVWMQGGTLTNYIKGLHEALTVHRAWMQSGETVMAGDFNNSAAFDRIRKDNHTRLVERLVCETGLVSAYHARSGSAHGDEAQPTFWQGKKNPKGFHIDYVFVPDAWKSRAKVSVVDGARWRRLSDHLPLCVDV